MSAIRVIYTQSGKFCYKYLHRFSTISLIIGISGLSFVTACGHYYAKSISITYKSFYKQILYSGLPGVCTSSYHSPRGFDVLNWTCTMTWSLKELNQIANFDKKGASFSESLSCPKSMSCSTNFQNINVLTFQRINSWHGVFSFLMNEVLQVNNTTIDRCLDLEDTTVALHETRD